jgi:hypothetical protein
MAKVLKRVARKDYPEQGIKKGDTYYKVSLKTGPRSSRTLKSLTPFKRWQLTSSDYLQTAYRLVDEDLPAIQSKDDFESFKQSVEDLKQEQEDKLDNMPDQLKESSIVQERYDELESFTQSLDGMDFDDEDDWKASDHDEEETYQDYVNSRIEEIQNDCPF